MEPDIGRTDGKSRPRGRFCYTGDVKKRTNPHVVASILAIAIAGGAAMYKFVFFTHEIAQPPVPPIGEAGSTHAHASILVMVNDRMIDFCKSAYMLKSDIVHFEDNDCHTIHKHATGVTVATFLKTIGVIATSDCLSVEGVSYCREGPRRVRAVYNGVEIAPEELRYREIKNNDHVLINYGADDELKLKFKYNQVPNIPLDVNEPVANE